MYQGLPEYGDGSRKGTHLGLFLVVMMQGYVRMMVQILQLLLGTPAKLSMLFQVLHEVEVTLGLVLTGD